MVEDDTQAELTTLQRQLDGQIKIADRIGEPHLAAILCEAQACVEKLLKR